MEDPPFTPDLLRLAYAQRILSHASPGYGRDHVAESRAALASFTTRRVSLLAVATARYLAARAFHGHRHDQDFRGVMAACGNREETWITDQFKTVYGELHDRR